MNGYFFKFIEPDIVEVHEDVATWRIDEKAILISIQAFQDPDVERTFTDHAYYERSLKLYEDALRFLRDEQS
jgi:hypothetical protein